MNDEIVNNLKKLKENRLLRSREEFFSFEEALESLADVSDIEIIKELCEILDDETEETEVMFGVIHKIEDFEGEVAMYEFAKAIPGMMTKAKEWARILNIGILNDDPSRKLYNRVLNETDVSTKEIIENLLLEIKVEDPDLFEEKVNEVLSKSGY